MHASLPPVELLLMAQNKFAITQAAACLLTHVQAVHVQTPVSSSTCSNSVMKHPYSATVCSARCWHESACKLPAVVAAGASVVMAGASVVVVGAAVLVIGATVVVTGAGVVVLGIAVVVIGAAVVVVGAATKHHPVLSACSNSVMKHP